MGNRKPTRRRVRSERYLRRVIGAGQILARRRARKRNEEYWSELIVQVRPGWQAGVATAAAFAKNLNDARELGAEIRSGRYPRREWLLRATWYSAWRAAEAILRPTLRDGLLVRSPWFLAPESARRFERFSAAHGVFFTAGRHGIPIVAGDDARAMVVLMMYEFFESRARDRLKCCLACRRWLVDETRNRTRRWCSDKCHTRGWSRAARRAAGHAQYARAIATKHGGVPRRGRRDPAPASSRPRPPGARANRQGLRRRSSVEVL
jgi:hypothetical protein